jgi:chromosome segregation ATPase
MPPFSAASASAPALGRNRTVTLLGILSGLLLLALLASGALAYVELDRRQARERALEEQIASLSQANRDFQAQVQSLTSERDRLATERDQLSDERDRLQSRLNELMATNAEQEKRIQELTGQVQEQSRQLSQVREEASRQQQRAETAEEQRSILVQVVALDEKIQDEFFRFATAVLEMQDAYYLGNRLAFDNAARRAEASKQRLDQLFAERDRLLKQLGF